MNKKTDLLALASVAVAPLAGLASVNTAKAATLDDIAVALSSTTVSTTTNVTLTFTTQTQLDNGTTPVLTVSYDSAFTGTVVDSDVLVTSNDVNLTGSSETISTGLITSDLTLDGDVAAGSTITVTISNTVLTNPGTAGNYSWSATLDVDGLGSTYDSGAGLASVGGSNQLTVKAYVPAVIDMELYEASNGTTSSDTLLADPNTCNLGVLSPNNINSCFYGIGFATNNAAGMTVQVDADGMLNDAGNVNQINDTTGVVTLGQEEYGFMIDGEDSSCGTVLSSFTSESVVPTTVGTLFSNDSSCNGTTSGQSANHLVVTHKASMDYNTVVGAYDQLVTYTAFTN
jgi:hypothetical protein